MRNFTLFAPTDKAIQQAYRSGSLNYPYLFAKSKPLLDGIVAYHAVPQYSFPAPSKQTLNMKTLLTEVRVSSGCCCVWMCVCCVCQGWRGVCCTQVAATS